ncbi:MAG: PAS domain-containing sensor histidine kinase [Patescibacteria group bacterium]
MIKQQGTPLEILTWSLIIIATFITIYFFPWYIAESMLRYLAAAGIIAGGFWYLRSNRLYLETQEKNRAIASQQRELASRQKTFDLIYEHSADGIIILDEFQKIISFSPGLERISGFETDEVLNKPVKDVLKFKGDSENSLLPDIMFLPANLKKQPYVKNSLITKQGNLIDIEASSTLVSSDREGKKALAIIRDVTYENELVRRDKEFIALTSHQLNTPLSIINGFVSLFLSGKVGKISPKQENYMREIEAAVSKMINLTGNMLSISRIEQESIKLEKNDISVAELFKNLDHIYAHTADKRGLKLAFSEVASNALAYADEDKLFQALSNLIDNALKYTPKGSVSVSFESIKENAVFKIADTGIGISDEDKPHVGDKFYRSQSAIDLDNHGTGLGVFIAKTITERHGGAFEIKSVVGKGTTFIISIPLK